MRNRPFDWDGCGAAVRPCAIQAWGNGHREELPDALVASAGRRSSQRPPVLEITPSRCSASLTKQRADVKPKVPNGLGGRHQAVGSRKKVDHPTLMTPYCLLPTAYCLLPTAYCLLPTASLPCPPASPPLTRPDAAQALRLDPRQG